MARSAHSPSPSPISPSPSISDSSADDHPPPLGYPSAGGAHIQHPQLHPQHPHDGLGPSVSRPGSPAASSSHGGRQHQGGGAGTGGGGRAGGKGAVLDSEDTVTCQWEECGVVFGHLPTLIDHIHNDHIGVHKSNYTCEWATCQRRGLAQTSRFALISHIRSHTGEKPFTCPRPECDKSFTRSDALAKHMRLQHNISPPAPGRGGSRKRKRVQDDQTNASAPPAPSVRPHTPPPPGATGAFSTFKVEPNLPEFLDDPKYDVPRERDHGRHSANGHHPTPNSPRSPGFARAEEDDGYFSASDTLPAHLLPHYVPSTNLVLGRSPAMVMYLLMKAKHRYALEQHEHLLEELKVVKAALKKEREEKEDALDLVLRSTFGSQAEPLIAPIPPPPGLGGLHQPSPFAPVYATNGNGR